MFTVCKSRFGTRRSSVFAAAIGTLALTFSMVQECAADEEITQYRYRAFDGTNPPSWVSSNSASQTVLPAIVKIERGTTNDAFEQFWYANFNGTNRYVCLDDVPGNDLSQDFSVTAWLNLNSITPNQTICSTIDSTNQTGFRLSITNGYLRGEAWFVTASGKTNRSVLAPSPLETGKWRRVTLRRYKDDPVTTHFMELWVDSARVAVLTIPLDDLIDNSALDPVFGADRIPGGYDNYLNAKVQQIQVDDYALSAFFLESPVVRDGSRTFGQPSYHDYIGEGDTKPLERRIRETYLNTELVEFQARLAGRWFFPFANDYYIPQGLTYDPESSRIFISMYYKNASGTNPDNFPSLVAEILMPAGRLGNVFLLMTETGSPMAAHVGGVVYVNGRLIVPDAQKLRVYDISTNPPGRFDPDTFSNFNPVAIQPEQTIFTNTTGSPLVVWDSIAFLDVHWDASHQAWILLGDYVDGNPSTNYLYHLNYQPGLPGFTLSDRITQRQLTDNMQGGATYHDAQGLRRMFQAGTGGNSGTGGYESRVVTAQYASGGISSIPPTLNVPRGLEQVSLHDWKLWTVSESGARYVQKSGWEECFPFFYSMRMDDRLDSNDNLIPDQWEATYNLPAGFNPDLDPDGDGFTTRQEYVADTNPNLGSNYPKLELITGPLGFSIYTSVLRFYTVETSPDLQVWTADPAHSHRRGVDASESFPIDTGQGLRGFDRVRVEEK